jgi:hypothetical protein
VLFTLAALFLLSVLATTLATVCLSPSFLLFVVDQLNGMVVVEIFV